MFLAPMTHPFVSLILMITDRDWTIMRALTFAVRLMSLEQVARVWWSEAGDDSRLAVAENSLARLTKVGLIERLKVLAFPLPTISEPVCVWTPGGERPDFHALEYKVQQRWVGTPTYIPAFAIGHRAVKFFGVNRPKAISIGQESHDLGQAEVYIVYVSRWPKEAADWQGEESYRTERKGEKLPDAMLFDSKGEPYRVIDFAGRYDHRRLRAFHEDQERRGLTYELW